MYIERKRYILRAVLIYFFAIDFQRSKGGFIFSKKIKTLDMFCIFNDKMWQVW